MRKLYQKGLRLKSAPGHFLIEHFLLWIQKLMSSYHDKNEDFSVVEFKMCSGLIEEVRSLN